MSLHAFCDDDTSDLDLDKCISSTEMHRAKGELEEALKTGSQGVAYWPDSSRMRCALGFLKYDCNDLDGAIEQFEKIIEFEPDNVRAHTGLGTSLLARGDWARGWKEFRWRLKLPGFSDIVVKNKPYWDGQFVNSLLLVAEGFGDTIQFLRYVGLVRQLCGRLTIICRAEINTLVEANVKDCVVTNNWNDTLDCDAYCVFTDISGLIEKKPSFAPAAYICADNNLARTWNTILKTIDGFKVGVFWAGNPTHFNDFRRSISPDYFWPLIDIPGIRLIGLQKGAPWINLPFPNYGDEFVDWMDTAALIDNLDMVISVDSAVAHLAGAMGKRVWTLLPFAAEWRWMRDVRDTHWYPSMRLFRQSQPGNWNEVISQVSEELKSFLRRLP